MHGQISNVHVLVSEFLGNVFSKTKQALTYIWNFFINWNRHKLRWCRARDLFLNHKFRWPQEGLSCESLTNEVVTQPTRPWPPMVTGICDPNKSWARYHHSLKLGSKLKYFNRHKPIGTGTHKWLSVRLQTKLLWVECRCSHLNFRFRACFEQGVLWHSGNCRVRIYSEMRMWHDKNIQL